MDGRNGNGDSMAERVKTNSQSAAVLTRLKKRLKLRRKAYEHRIRAENSKPLDKKYVDDDIVELIQGVGTPTRSWLTTLIEQAINSRRRVLSSREGTNKAPRTKPEGKDTTTEVVILGVLNPPITPQQHQVIRQT